MKSESHDLLRFLINYTFGALTIPLCIIQVDDINKIVLHYEEHLTNLFKDYPNHVIYIDTDVIYFDFLDNNIIDKYIKPLNIPYKIDDELCGIFFQKKKYLAHKSVTSREAIGFTIYKSTFYKEKERIKKLKKIHNIFNEKEI